MIAEPGALRKLFSSLKEYMQTLQCRVEKYKTSNATIKSTCRPSNVGLKSTGPLMQQ
jgi:hypothetical protein